MQGVEAAKRRYGLSFMIFFFFLINQLIIHLPCWAAFPSLSWVFDRSSFSNAHFSVFCFISGLLAYMSFMSALLLCVECAFSIFAL